jgi:hypothetical protein
MKDKVILTDCDGVLFDWVYAFGVWMKRHGYRLQDENAYNVTDRYDLGMQDKKRLVRMFNESAAIRKIPPLRDAIKYVRKLHQEHGYIFHAITSLSNDQYAQHLRTKNLIEMFGPSVFEKYVYLDCGADKDEALSEYKDTGCYWVEDKMENADVGLDMGLESILIAHPYNTEYKGEAHRFQSWKEIYDLVTS